MNLLRGARCIFIAVLVASVAVWPASGAVAFMVLSGPASAWTPIGIVLVVLMAVHVPLCAWTRRRVLAAEPSAARRPKLRYPVLRYLVPPGINALVLGAMVFHLRMICAWQYSCWAI